MCGGETTETDFKSMYSRDIGRIDVIGNRDGVGGAITKKL
jgi:hypothetical protein